MHKHIELLLYVVIGFLVVGTASVLYFDTNTITPTTFSSVEIPITGAVTGLQSITGQATGDSVIGLCEEVSSSTDFVGGCYDATFCEDCGLWCSGRGPACESGYHCVHLSDSKSNGKCVRDPIGNLDYVGPDLISGWALDPYSPNVNIEIHIYINGVPGACGAECVMIPARAGLPSPDVQQVTGYEGSHRFNVPFPSHLRTTPSTVHVYAIAWTSNPSAPRNPELSGSPKEYPYPFTCFTDSECAPFGAGATCNAGLCEVPQSSITPTATSPTITPPQTFAVNNRVKTKTSTIIYSRTTTGTGGVVDNTLFTGSLIDNELPPIDTSSDIPAGELDGECIIHSDCETGLVCLGRSQSRTCQRIACTSDTTCTSKAGGSGTTCLNGFCAPKLATGAPCTSSLNCKSNTCTNNICVASSTSTSTTSPFTSKGTQPAGALGTIVGGSIISSNTIWWDVNFDSGVDGWVQQPSLEITLIPASGFRLLTPANNAVNIGAAPTLTWAPLSGGRYYYVQVDDENTFTEPLVYQTPDSAVLSSSTTQFTVPANLLLSGTKYYWRVNAKKSGGYYVERFYPDNTPFSFTRAASSGTKISGETCVNNEDCRSGVCFSININSLLGNLQGQYCKGDLGDLSVRSGFCESPAFYSLGVATGGIRGGNLEGNNVCGGEQATCTSNAQCLSGDCSLFKCTAPSTPPQETSTTGKVGGEECTKNAQCLSGTCSDPITFGGVTKRICLTDLGNPALSGIICGGVSGIIYTGGTDNLCGGTGAFCTANNACVSNTCDLENNLCIAAPTLKTAGQTCTDTTQCQSGLTCTEQAGKKICFGTIKGVPCFGSGICANDGTNSFYCGVGTCGGFDAQCTSKDQCTTGLCTSGKCKLQTVTITGIVGPGGICNPSTPNDPAKTCGTGLLCSNKKCVTTTQQDPDSDGLTNAEETTHNTDPNDPDSDDDGLKDGEEVKTHHTDPNDADSDNDRWKDGAEVLAGSDPNNTNSKPQGCQNNNGCSGGTSCDKSLGVGVCVRPPVSAQNGWPGDTCRGQNGIACGEGEGCKDGNTNKNPVINLDVYNCCIGINPSCTSSDYIPSLGQAVEIIRGQCADPDQDGEGIRTVTIKGASLGTLTPEDLITECASVSCTNCKTTSDGGSCDVACTTLPNGGETRTTVPYYTIGGALITLSLIFGAYFFRKKRKL